MQSTPATPNAAAPTAPDTPDTPETLLLDADAELRASSHQRAPTPETVLTGADAELRAVLRETPQRARAPASRASTPRPAATSGGCP